LRCTWACMWVWMCAAKPALASSAECDACVQLRAEDALPAVRRDACIRTDHQGGCRAGPGRDRMACSDGWLRRAQVTSQRGVMAVGDEVEITRERLAVELTV